MDDSSLFRDGASPAIQNQASASSLSASSTVQNTSCGIRDACLAVEDVSHVTLCCILPEKKQAVADDGEQLTDCDIKSIQTEILNPVCDRPLHAEMSAREKMHPKAGGEDNRRCKQKSNDLLYGIDDVPPWYLCIVLGFQHYLTMFGATVSVPLILAPALCIGSDRVALSELISTIFFVSGIVTLLQTTLGSRLPIIQGGTFAFLTPALAILSLDKWKCPGENGELSAALMTSDNETMATELDWTSRIREIQGAIILASMFEILIGLSGVVGLLLRFIGPLSIAPTISLIGLALAHVAADFCSKQWGIAIMTMALVTLFSQYMRNVEIPRMRFPFFKLFPVILAILISWGICGILTAANVFSKDPEVPGHEARTDTKIDVLAQADWFRVPYPGQWGAPTFSTASVLGMLAGVLAGMIESVGDYYACARIAGAPPPPVHAVNRGIFVEGIGCVLAGLWGTSTGTTSYSENIGAIGITKVASRRVVQSGGAIMIVLGMFGKFGALFVTIPGPIVGGIFMVMFGMISAVGISNLQFVDLNSSRNLFIFGFSIFFGLSLPPWVSTNRDAIATGNTVVDQIIAVLLTTSMFVGGTVGFILDNTIPGTAKERGLLQWRQHVAGSGTSEQDDAAMTSARSQRLLQTYDLPFGMSLLRRSKIARYIPIMPTFRMGAGRRAGRDAQEEHRVLEMSCPTTPIGEFENSRA